MIEKIVKDIINLPNTFIGEGPIDVDDCQWIRLMSGKSKVYFNKDTYDYPTYTVYVRGTNNEETTLRTLDVFHKLQNYVGKNFVILANRLPRFVGRDDKYRAIYAIKIEYQLGGY